MVTKSKSVSTKAKNLKTDFRKLLVYCGSFKKRDIKIFKKVLKGHESCSVKVTKRTRKPILFVDGKRIGPLNKAFQLMLNQHKEKNKTSHIIT